MLSLKELVLLAYLSGHKELAGISDLPSLKEKECRESIAMLKDKGMVNIYDKKASVDAALGFVLHTMCTPLLIVQLPNGALGYAAKKIFIYACGDRYSRDRRIITPVPTAAEAANVLWDNADHVFDEVQLKLYENKDWKDKAVSKPALIRILSEVME